MKTNNIDYFDKESKKIEDFIMSFCNRCNELSKMNYLNNNREEVLREIVILSSLYIKLLDIYNNNFINIPTFDKDKIEQQDKTKKIILKKIEESKIVLFNSIEEVMFTHNDC